MPHRSPARYLAPLALALAFFAVLMVLSSGDDQGSGTTVDTRPAATPTTTAKAKAPRPRKRPTTYTVRSGDVLSAIAEKTGVPLERLLELNEDLDPQMLRAGQKLTLRR